MNKQPFYLLISLLILMAACSRTEKVTSFESDSSLPYIPLGTLEIQEKFERMSVSRTLLKSVEIGTLGLVDIPTRSSQYKKVLREKLARTAKKRYQADAVINVHYWPDPVLKEYPSGTIFARGDMIRYKKFPLEAEVQPAV